MMDELGIMLTDEQKKDLETRNDDGVSARRRADIVHRFTGKLKDRLDDLKDINYLLSELPATSVNNTVSNEHVYLAFQLVERLLKILDPIPIINDENPQYTREYYIKDVKGLKGMMYYPETEKKGNTNNLERVKVSFPMTQKEIEIYHKLQLHNNAIKNFVYGRNKDKPEIYSLPEFSKLINDIASKRGQLYQIKTVFSSAEVVGDDPKPGDYATLPEIDETISSYIKKECPEKKS